MKPNAYLGIDVGSVSVKMALIDESNNLVDKVYLRNRGVLETVPKALEQIATDEYKIAGAGVTGSGRKFVQYLVNADIVKAETLAHIRATLHYYPDARTIMDIGGEDCKLLLANNGVLYDFSLNNICGAGTGSVLDSIAARMGIPVEEIGELALSHQNKMEFPGKCGVFAQSSVVSRLNAGAKKSDILMGVIRGLVRNYLTLAKGKMLHPPFVYQGATAKNIAIVKALEEALGSEIIIPEHPEIMGAIGIALIAKECSNGPSSFRGFRVKNEKFEAETYTANGCGNHCEITVLYRALRKGGKRVAIGSIGNGCDKCVPSSLSVKKSGE